MLVNWESRDREVLNTETGIKAVGGGLEQCEREGAKMTKLCVGGEWGTNREGSTPKPCFKCVSQESCCTSAAKTPVTHRQRGGPIPLPQIAGSSTSSRNWGFRGESEEPYSADELLSTLLNH